jgi:hypothetical protein
MPHQFLLPPGPEFAWASYLRSSSRLQLHCSVSVFGVEQFLLHYQGFLPCPLEPRHVLSEASRPRDMAMTPAPRASSTAPANASAQVLTALSKAGQGAIPGDAASTANWGMLRVEYLWFLMAMDSRTLMQVRTGLPMLGLQSSDDLFEATSSSFWVGPYPMSHAQY